MSHQSHTDPELFDPLDGEPDYEAWDAKLYRDHLATLDALTASDPRFISDITEYEKGLKGISIGISSVLSRSFGGRP